MGVSPHWGFCTEKEDILQTRENKLIPALLLQYVSFLVKAGIDSDGKGSLKSRKETSCMWHRVLYLLHWSLTIKL